MYLSKTVVFTILMHIGLLQGFWNSYEKRAMRYIECTDGSIEVSMESYNTLCRVSEVIKNMGAFERAFHLSDRAYVVQENLYVGLNKETCKNLFWFLNNRGADVKKTLKLLPSLINACDFLEISSMQSVLIKILAAYFSKNPPLYRAYIKNPALIETLETDLGQNITGQFVDEILNNTYKKEQFKCINTMKTEPWANHLAWDSDLDIVIANKKIEIRNKHTNQRIKTLQGHGGSVLKVIKMKNYIISGSTDQSIKIWDFDSGNCIKTLKGHTLAISSLGVLNQRTIISGSQDATIKIWDVPSGFCIETLNRVGSAVVAVSAFLDEYIIAGTLDGSIKIFDWKQKKCLQTIKHAHPCSINALHNNGNYFVSRCSTETKMWSKTGYNSLQRSWRDQSSLHDLFRLLAAR